MPLEVSSHYYIKILSCVFIYLYRSKCQQDLLVCNFQGCFKSVIHLILLFYILDSQGTLLFFFIIQILGLFLGIFFCESTNLSEKSEPCDVNRPISFKGVSFPTSPLIFPFYDVTRLIFSDTVEPPFSYPPPSPSNTGSLKVRGAAPSVLTNW